ncbi:AarF/UbiB family protein, partial [bacterium]|nr:AarF/UbiB family protein [bacterium]
VKCFLQEGFYHADLHAGNFILLKSKDIAIIDFGLIGSLSVKSRRSFLALIYAILNHNYENLVYEFVDVAHFEKLPNLDELIADVKSSLAPFVGLTVSQVSFSDILQAIMKTLYKHRIFLPNDWMMVFRALVTLDGVGKSLDIDVDLFSLLEKDIEGLLSNAFNKKDLIDEALWTSRDLFSTLRVFPRHLKWFSKEWAKKNYAIEIIHKGHETSFKDLSLAIRFLGMMIVSSILIFSGTNLIPKERIYTYENWPALAYALIILGLLILFTSIYNFKVVNKKKR